MDEDLLHEMTRLPSPSNDSPAITILVHGLGGDSSNWATEDFIHVSYDNTSLIEMLINEGYNYYIDIVVPNEVYNTLTLTIERIENPIEIDLVNYEHEYDGDPTNDDYIYVHNIITNETQIGDQFVMLEILESSNISVIYDYIGSQEESIYFVLFRETYINNEMHYEIQLVFPEMMVTYGESLEWNSSITSGTYYIG